MNKKLVNFLNLLIYRSKQEFDDFVADNECLEIKSFLLAYACYENICCSVGMYETNADMTLRRYLNLDKKVILHDNYEDSDNLVEDIKKINSLIADNNKKCIVFFDDTYCEGVY